METAVVMGAAMLTGALAARLANPRKHVTDQVKDELKTPEFNMWRYNKEELIYLLEAIFIDSGIQEEFGTDRATLLTFLQACHDNYNDNPFHNFHHCFSVTQMVYCILVAIRDDTELTRQEMLTVLLAAACHDLDHPGLNNGYLVNSSDDLALFYNDKSPLENHHCSTGFMILQRDSANVFRGLSPKDRKAVRSNMIECILATDMKHHWRLLAEFEAMVDDGIDWTKDDHRTMVLRIILMSADISNEVRPWQVSVRWARRLVEEFGAQYCRETVEGLPKMEFMNKDTVVIETSQMGFISGILRPLWVAASRVFPALDDFVGKIDENYHRWSETLDKSNCVQLMEILDTEREFEHITVRHMAAGDFIMRKGDTSREMYFLRKGSVEVGEFLDDSEIVFETLEAGRYFGEIVAFQDVPRTADVRAATDIEVFCVDKDDVHKLLELYPEQAKKIKAVAQERMTVTARMEHNFEEDHLVHMGGG